MYCIENTNLSQGCLLGKEEAGHHYPNLNLISSIADPKHTLTHSP